MSSAKTLQQFVFVAMSKSFFWIGRVWVTFGRIWKRSGKGCGDVWGFLPTSMSSKMDQRQLQAFATVRRAEKHPMFAEAKSRKKKNETEIQYSECKTFQIFLSAIRCSRRAGCHCRPQGGTAVHSIGSSCRAAHEGF